MAIFNQLTEVITGPILYLAFILNKIGKIFLDLIFYLILTGSLKFTSISFSEVTNEIEKNIITRQHACVHFENEPHPKNG